MTTKFLINNSEIMTIDRYIPLTFNERYTVFGIECVVKSIAESVNTVVISLEPKQESLIHETL